VHIAAIKIPVDHLLNIRPPESVSPRLTGRIAQPRGGKT
jgi:hypothetical protein